MNNPAEGLSKLEYFTAQSLQGLLASESEDHGYYTTIYRDPEGRETSYRGPTNNPYELIRTAEESIALRAVAIAKATLRLLAKESI